jgi:quercetin dioxygenase-like cupin family protein
MEAKMSDWLGAVRHLVDLAADRFEAAGVASAPVAEATALMRRETIRVTAREPSRAPACRHWDRLLNQASDQGQGDLADALRPLGNALGWSSGGDFYGPTADDLHQTLAYADVVGPYGGLFAAEGYHIGPIIFGPHMNYPAHAHQAAEFYYLLAGNGEWQRGDEAWTSRPPGALFYHAPNMPHAARTADEPVLALVCLFGDVKAPPVLL